MQDFLNFFPHFLFWQWFLHQRGFPTTTSSYWNHLVIPAYRTETILSFLKTQNVVKRNNPCWIKLSHPLMSRCKKVPTGEDVCGSLTLSYLSTERYRQSWMEGTLGVRKWCVQCFLSLQQFLYSRLKSNVDLFTDLEMWNIVPVRKLRKF